MGNCPCQSQKENIFQIENKNNEKNIILVMEKNSIEEKLELFNNIENKIFELNKFLEIINKIYNNIDALDEKNIYYFKNSIKVLLLKLKEDNFFINNYLNSIDKIIKNKYDLEEIKNCKSLFELIYSNKDDIGESQISSFISAIRIILESSEKFDENEINILCSALNNIFFKDKKDANININLVEDENLQKLETREETKKGKNEEEKEEEKVEEIKENEKEDQQSEKDSSKLKNTISDFEGILKHKNSDSNFSKYSESSKNQIVKLEDSISQYKIDKKKDEETIRQLMEKIKILEKNNKNEINLKFYDNIKKKEYNLKISKKDIQFGKILEILYKKYPNLKNKNIKNYNYKKNKINNNEIIHFSDSDRIDFAYY